ncbi:PIN domain-containing protein [hot springs metagenome]|uniref:PIN domain-containing protein n=1 Tax=hot springs metagenome TaxID=433727 RepID=A0A5J4KXH7_9ZZZZ
MIKDGVIADTSTLIDFLKNNEPCAAVIETLIKEKRLLTTGIIMAELLQGIKTITEENSVAELLEGIPVVEIDSVIWLKAGRISCALRRNGITLPLTDVAIAALCINHNLSIFTLDKHFQQIPGLKLFRIS